MGDNTIDVLIGYSLRGTDTTDHDIAQENFYETDTSFVQEVAETVTRFSDGDGQVVVSNDLSEDGAMVV